MNLTTKCKYFNKWRYNEGQFKLSPHKPISLHFFTYMINCLLACYRHETSCSFDYTHSNKNWNLSLFIYIVSTRFFYEHNNLNRSQDISFAKVSPCYGNSLFGKLPCLRQKSNTPTGDLGSKKRLFVKRYRLYFNKKYIQFRHSIHSLYC
jgi:hypothetical protein